MKYCSKCGKELLDEAVICVGCGCPVEKTYNKKIRKIAPNIDVSCEYLEKNSKDLKLYINLSVAFLLLGIAAFLLLNIWVGAVITLLSLIFAIYPQNLVKKQIKKQKLDIDEKIYTKEVINKYSLFKTTFILMIVAGVILCLEAVGIIIIDIFLASLSMTNKPSINSFVDYLRYLNSSEYIAYKATEATRKAIDILQGY